MTIYTQYIRNIYNDEFMPLHEVFFKVETDSEESINTLYFTALNGMEIVLALTLSFTKFKKK